MVVGGCVVVDGVVVGVVGFVVSVVECLVVAKGVDNPVDYAVNNDEIVLY